MFPAVLAELGAGDKPVLNVFNKIDRIPEADFIARETEIRNQFPESVFVSATAPGGLEPLRRALLSTIRTRLPITEIRLPVTAGKLLAEIHRDTEVLDQVHEGEELILHARMDASVAGRLRKAGAAVGNAR